MEDLLLTVTDVFKIVASTLLRITSDDGSCDFGLQLNIFFIYFSHEDKCRGGLLPGGIGAPWDLSP